MNAQQKSIKCRLPNFSTDEEILLLDLLKKKVHILESKKTDAVTSRLKQRTWNEIAKEFASTSGFKRTAKNLREKYENLKRKAKKYLAKNNVEDSISNGREKIKDASLEEVAALLGYIDEKDSTTKRDNERKMLDITSKMDARWSSYSKLNKCGELTISKNLDTVGLNCMFCETICLQLESFIKHISNFHKAVISEVIGDEPENSCIDEIETIYDVYENSLTEINTEEFDILDETMILAETVKSDSDEPMNESDTLAPSDYNDMERFKFVEIDLASPDNTSEIDENIEVPVTLRKQLYLSFDVHSIKNYPLITRIIKGYKDNPILWDTDDVNYIRPHLKRRVLEHLTKEIQLDYKINFEPSDLRQIFIGLRRLYDDEKKHSTSAPQNKDSTMGIHTKLWCYEQMNFLDKLKQHTVPTITTAKHLIIAEIYEHHPALWHMHDRSYRIKETREAAFEQMFEETNVQLETKIAPYQLTNYIRRVRRFYSVNKRHRIQCAQNNTTYKPPHPEYEDILKYLDGHVGPFCCNVCNLITHSYDHHIKHMKEHGEHVDYVKKAKYECDICHKCVQNSYTLKVHKRIHTGEMPFSCEVCGRTFLSRGSLKIHIREHTGDLPYICDVCGKACKTTSLLSRHKMYHNTESFRFECTMCPKKLPDKRHLREHMNAHLERREHVCQVCNKGFFARKTLRQHEQLHSEHKKHACNICGKTFAQRTGLNSHLHRVHQVSTLKAPTINADMLK